MQIFNDSFDDVSPSCKIQIVLNENNAGLWSINKLKKAFYIVSSF